MVSIVGVYGLPLFPYPFMILEIVDGSRLHSVASLDEEIPLSLRWHCNNNDNFVLGLCLGCFFPKANTFNYLFRDIFLRVGGGLCGLFTDCLVDI